MRKIKSSNENEMVHEFLKMEFNSDHRRESIESILKEMQISKDIIINGNIISEQENTLRAEILRRFRGWRDSKLFGNFPLSIEWVWTEFDREDILKIVYMDIHYWNEFSYFTGSPLEAAKYVLSGKPLYDKPTDGAIKGAQWLIEGNRFPPMIFLTDKSEERYIVLEGHNRMTAYGLVPVLFQNVSVLLGYCERRGISQWRHFPGEILRTSK